jgi:hypothetical protein
LTATTIGTDTCNWPGLRPFLKLKRETTIRGETKTTVAHAVTLSFVGIIDGQRVAGSLARPLAIENRLFWVKDVTLREDHSRIRSGKAAFAMSIIRSASINNIRTSGQNCITAAFRSNALRIPVLLARPGIFI